MLALYLALPIACILAVPRSRARKPGALAGPLVVGLALYQVLLLANGLTLGLLRRLTPRNYAALTAISIAVLGTLALRRLLRERAVRTDWRWFRTRRGVAIGAIAGVLALSFALQLAADASWGTRHWDGLGYHLSRALSWIQQGSFDAWPTPTWQEIGLPVGADVVLASKVLLGLGWAGTSYVTALLTLGSIGCVYLAALDLGVPRWHSLVGALLFASFPAIGLRVWHLNSDIAAAFPVMAGYVVLVRIARPDVGLAAFIALSGVGMACKPTVAPFVILLGAVAIWRKRPALRARDLALPTLGGALGCAAIAGSYWPVHEAFGDAIGGEFGRACAVGGARDFARALAGNLVHWLAEPLGYVPIAHRGERVATTLTQIYEWLGVFTERGLLGAQLAVDWQPAAQPDTARTGLVALAAFPVALATLPKRGRVAGALLWVTGFVAISGMIYAQPWSGRFAVVVLGGYALTWTGSCLFRRGRARWVLAVITAANVATGLLVTAWTARADRIGSRPGGVFDVMGDSERDDIARGGHLLWVVGESSDALLVGTRVELRLQKLVCPSDGDWVTHLRAAAARSPILALSHWGASRVAPGPRWKRREDHACPEIEVKKLRSTLRAAGWSAWTSTRNVELWRHGDPAADVR